MTSRALLPSAVLTLALTGVGVADYVLKERPAASQIDAQNLGSSSGSSDNVSSQAPSSASSAQGVAKGVSRREGPAVKEILVERTYTWSDYPESTLLEEILGSGSAQKLVLLRENDRAAGMAWIDAPDAKETFDALKAAIQQSFSGNVTDIVDETVRPDDGAPHDILAFRDPAISPERVVFARIRSRLYEFHVVDGHEQEISGIIAELARR